MFSFTKKKFSSIPKDASWLLAVADRAASTPPEMLHELNACIIGTDQDITMVAATNPSNPALQRYVQQHIGCDVTWHIATTEDIAQVVRASNFDHRGKINSLLAGTALDESVISKAVTYLIQFAFSEGASDIHIEPQKYEAMVRFRVDGVLHEVISIPNNHYPATVARIKILAQLRTDETRRPQDGRIEPEGYEGASLRVSIMPTLYGEKIVMRVLNHTSAILEQEALGFSAAQTEIIKRNIEKPFGMIVASGPTGSGKSTTLYSLLNLLSAKTANIATLEDPIEYALPGVNQTQVNPDFGFSFAHGLRSLLRQDPDVILVGEVRDQETTSMAAQASMTGHLVLTSMHTNDAPSAFTRFIEMGVEEFMLVSTVNLVIAQRLVRKLCPHCSEHAKLPEILQKKILEREDITTALSPHIKNCKRSLATRTFLRPVGCDKCLNSGYISRIGIFELLEMSPDLHEAILSGASSDEIRKIATKNGFTSMLSDGIEKVMNGHTTFEEVLRTTRTN